VHVMLGTSTEIEGLHACVCATLTGGGVVRSVSVCRQLP